jgi:hypothetical protein
MTTTLIHQGPAYELSLAIDASPYGHHLKFISFVPIARNPEQQVRVSGAPWPGKTSRCSTRRRQGAAG